MGQNTSPAPRPFPAWFLPIGRAGHKHGSGFPGNADPMANLRWNRQRLVGLMHVVDLFIYVRREWGGFLRGHVDMHDDQLRHAGQPALFGMEHLLHVMHAFGVTVEKLRLDPHRIASMEFAHIGVVAFQREERGVAVLHVVRAEAHGREGLVARPVEQHIVIGHVEMAVIVGPLVLDLLDSAHERGGIGHRKFSGFC